eukprot:5839026-Amphidinium_carterae.2
MPFILETPKRLEARQYNSNSNIKVQMLSLGVGPEMNMLFSLLGDGFKLAVSKFGFVPEISPEITQ